MALAVSPWNVLSFLLQGVVLLFTCLALGLASRQARVYLPWLVPLVIAQVLDLLTSLSSYFLIAQHLAFSQAQWMLIPQQIAGGFGTLAGIWFAVALFLTLRSNAFPSRQTPPPQIPGSWPPPPSV